MSHRTTNNCTLTRHFIAPLFLYCFCCFFNGARAADNPFINVYLKLDDDTTLTTMIKNFNHWLTAKPSLSGYAITPYIEQHPAHITLYLTHYNKKNAPLILKKVQQLAQQEHPFSITTEALEVYNTYIMLRIKNNKVLQRLNASSVYLLKELRNKNSPIPAWAAADVKQQQSFTLYGSPGVLTLYNPHISIVQVSKIAPIEQKIVTKQLTELTDIFNRQHPIQHQTLIRALAVGIANKEGQITEELASFPLS